MNDWKSSVAAFFERFSVFKRSEPIDSSAKFGDFLATRAAFVGQKKLYEYVKTRMGITYPRHFRDEIFIESLNIAKWQVYAACLSDLAIWMAAQVYSRTGDVEETRQIAQYWFDRTIDDRFEKGALSDGPQAAKDEFGNRLALIDWNSCSKTDYAFSQSPKKLVHWAPIAPELKKYDVEVVENSIRFAWVAIRQDFNDVYDHEAFLADWHENLARS